MTENTNTVNNSIDDKSKEINNSEKKSEKKKFEIEDLIKRIDKKYYWIIAGLLTVLLAYLTFSFAGMLKSGMFVMVRGDLAETHVPYIRMLCRHILNGETPWYSFDISMGMNTSLALAYYALSPVNVLYLIFYNVDVNVVTAVVIIVKMALAAIFFQLFCAKGLKVDDIKSVLFSICYAFCGFMACYASYHIMWQDAYFMLPLICLFVIYGFEKKKFAPLIACYAYVFISQFYMGYMDGVFSFIFLLGFLAFKINKENYKEYIKLTLRWVGAGIIAVLISAFVWVPTLLFLLINNPPDATDFTNLNVTVMEIFNSMFWGQFNDIIGRHSYTYTGLPVLLLLPFYFLNKKISIKEKIIAGVTVAFILICYICIPFYKFMHAFDAPDFFWFRFSYVFSFLLCILAVRQSMFIKEIKISGAFKYLIALVLFFSIEYRLQKLEAIPETANTPLNLIINVLFILAWIGIAFLSSKEKVKKVSLAALAILLLSVEVVSNMNLCLYGKTKEGAYYNWENVVNHSLDLIYENEGDSKNFYRLIVNNDIIHNSDSFFGYNGVCDFASCENWRVRNTLANLGFATTSRMTTATGYNPVANMLLDIKYVIECKYMNEDVIYTNDEMYENDVDPVINMYSKTLNLGYMVNDDMINYSFPGRNVFENMNDILYRMTGIEDKCFTRISKDNIKYVYYDSLVYQNPEVDENMYFMEFYSEDGIVHLKVTNDDLKKVYAQFQVENPLAEEGDFVYGGGVNTVNGHDDIMNLSPAIELPYEETSNEFLLDIGRSETSEFKTSFDNINIYEFDDDIQKEFFDDLSKEQFVVDDYKSGFVRGHINVEGDRRLMMTSIPYDEGWSVFVNGREVETLALVDGTFLGLQLPDTGTYEIVMKYKLPGMDKGMILTVSGVLLLVVMVIFEFVLKKKKKEAVAENEAE